MAGSRRDRRAALDVREAFHQGQRVGMARPCEQAPDGAVLDHLARVHHGDLVTQAGHHAQVVRDVEDGGAGAPAQVGDQVEDPRLGSHVESRRRLVEDQDVGITRQRDGDRDALLLAAGELVWVAGRERGRGSAG